MKKKLGLAFGSGGARGMAHIGVIKGLNKIGVDIECISGSSAGAMIGGMFASGMKAEEIENVISSLDYLDIWKLLTDPVWGSGLVKGQKIMNFLQKYIGDINIENLKVPFCAVATDINTAEKVVLDKGNLVAAIRASCSIPLIFEPFLLGGKTLVDGGVSSPVPVSDARSMGADIVIAVNLDSIYFLDENNKKGGVTSTISVLNNSYQILRYNLARMETREADLVLEPRIEYINDFDFAHVTSYIKGGEDVVMQNKEKILKLIG